MARLGLRPLKRADRQIGSASDFRIKSMSTYQANNAAHTGPANLGGITALAVLVGSISISAAPAPAGFMRLLVKPKAHVAEQRLKEIFETEGVEQEGVMPQIGIRILKVSEAHRARVIWALQHNPNFEFTEPDAAVAPDFIPNDPSYGSQWHLPKINGPTAWDSTTGASGVVIAILDSGVNASHVDLVSQMVPGWNFYDNNSNTTDVYGHGTKVAGSAAAAGNNAQGVAGVAWGCRIMPIRISDTAGYGYISTITQGLTFAADQGARVANVSFSVSTSPSVASAAQYFQSRGGVVTISAGNASTFDASGDNPYVLTVSATGSTDALASWSNTGNNVDISAPGVGIYTTTSAGGYASVSGTSFSAPVVAGVAALAISANPLLSSNQIQDILKLSALDLGTAGWDSQYGAGRVNAAAAVALALATSPASDPPPQPDTNAPTAKISSPTNEATVSGTVSVKISGTDDQAVVMVRLFINGSLAGESATSTASFSWSTLSSADGGYSLEARAYDEAGNSGSTTISVTVSNSGTATGSTKGGVKGRRK